MRPDRRAACARLKLHVRLLVPALIGGCLVFGWLAPAPLRHWMDVPLVALMVVPRWVDASGVRKHQRYRELSPSLLNGPFFPR